jgi:hypothetical protein
VDGRDAQLLALVIDDEDFADADAVVDAEVFCYERGLVRSVRRGSGMNRL